MSQIAYVTFVNKSLQSTITLDEVLQQFTYYKEIMSKTGKQLDWQYTERAFPYDISTIERQPVPLLHLTSTQDRYKEIYVGVKREDAQTTEDANVIFIALTNQSTFGDKGKATEFAKFLAKKYEGQLTLFNERIMYYNKR
ncbi:MAG: DUF1885 family protein [Bacillaceae bacterium]